MTRFGQEIETRYLDEDRKVEYISNIKDFAVCSAYKRSSVRVKVYNKKEEMVEFLAFSKLLDDKRQDGSLVRGDLDPDLRPSFVVEYPKHNTDGGYFVIRTLTEIIP